MVNLIIGIVLILVLVGMVIGCIHKTPANLRGFYGLMFILIATVGAIGGIYLIVSGILAL